MYISEGNRRAGRMSAAKVFSHSLVLVVLMTTSASVWGQVLVDENCPSHRVVQNFNVTRYLGKWYEYQKLNFSSKATGVCITAEYSAAPMGGVIVHNTQYDPKTHDKHDAMGSARLNSTSGEGKLVVSFAISGNIGRPYWVISTDYDSYTVVWSCLNLGNSSLQFSWVLTREKTPRDEVLQTVHEVLDAEGLGGLPYLRTLQNCPNN